MIHMQRSSSCVTWWSPWLIHQTALGSVAAVAAQAPGAGTAPIGRIRSTGLPIIAGSKTPLTEAQAERRERGETWLSRFQAQIFLVAYFRGVGLLGGLVRPDQDGGEDGKPVDCRLQVCWESEPHEQVEGKVRRVKWTYCSGVGWVWGPLPTIVGAERLSTQLRLTV